MSIIIPFTGPTAESDSGPPLPPPSETFLLIAAADMHSQDRLVKPEGGPKAEPTNA